MQESIALMNKKLEQNLQFPDMDSRLEDLANLYNSSEDHPEFNSYAEAVGDVTAVQAQLKSYLSCSKRKLSPKKGSKKRG